MTRFSACFALFAVLSIALFAGCTSSNPACNGSAFLLDEEPKGGQSVVEVREALVGPIVQEHEHADDEAGHTHDEAEHEHSDAEHTHEHADHDHAEHDHAADHDHEHAPVEPAGPIEVVMVGMVGGLHNPWEKTETEFPFGGGEAKLFLCDVEAVAEHEEHGHHHAPGEECAFCAAHAADQSDQIAVVQFLGKDGKILPCDARQMFDLKGGETVVVFGEARVVEGGLLVVEARKIFVRR